MHKKKASVSDDPLEVIGLSCGEDGLPFLQNLKHMTGYKRNYKDSGGSIEVFNHQVSEYMTSSDDPKREPPGTKWSHLVQLKSMFSQSCK